MSKKKTKGKGHIFEYPRQNIDRADLGEKETGLDEEA